MDPEATALTFPRPVLAHPDLPASAKLIYAMLLSRKDADGTVRVDKTWLARQIGLDRRQVFTMVKKMEAHGLLVIHRPEAKIHYYSFPSAA
jgi:hypothetical protein